MLPRKIKELLTFLGGFEKWPVLNEDCRREVVKYLDYKSRFNLGICSKDDYETVEKTKIYVKSVEIVDNQRFHSLIKLFNNVTVRIHFPTGSPIECFFSQIEQDTRVQWLHHIPKKRLKKVVVKEVIWKSCNYYEEAVKFAEKWMKKSNFELNAIKVEMKKYPFESSQMKSLPCCKKLIISAGDADSLNWWLTRCPEQLDDIQLILYSNDEGLSTLPSNFLDAPQILQASMFYFWCRVAFSDEQLLKLKAKAMNFDSVEVTDRGINKFIRNWVFGKAVDGFRHLHLWSRTARNPDVMMAGLDEVKEWDDAFENEHEEFVENFKRRCGRGRCYQIKSKVNRFDSLTLLMERNCVSIVATGKRAEHNGEAYTYYRIP
ncbi:unnamed protein product [Caenorhabditis brenneri]